MSITRVSEWGIFMSVFHYICSFPISLKWYQNKRLQKQNYTIDVQTILYVKNPQGDLEKLAWYKVSENEHCWFKYLISSVTQSCLSPWDPMDCSMPGLPVHHQLWQLAQTHVHQGGDAFQPSSSVVPFSSCLQSFPAWRSYPLSQFFTSGAPRIGTSASVLPMNIQDWFPLLFTGLTSWLSKGLSRVFSSTTIQTSILRCSAFFMV